MCSHATATGQVHYGASAACNSCRAFFKRSVQSGKQDRFFCRGLGGNNGVTCEIKSKSWKSCRKCRFQKCLSAGMRPNWVLSEGERRIRYVIISAFVLSFISCFLPDVALRYGNRNSVKDSSLVPVSRPIDSGVHPEIFLLLHQLFHAFRHNNYLSAIADPESFDSKLYREKTLQWAHHGGCYDQEMVDMIGMTTNLAVSRFIKGRIVSPGDNILDADLDTLAKHNLPAVRAAFNAFSALHADRADTVLKYYDGYEAYLKGLAWVNGNLADFYAVAADPAFKRRVASGCYSQFFTSPWATDEGLERRHRLLSEDMSRWMYEASIACSFLLLRHFA